MRMKIFGSFLLMVFAIVLFARPTAGQNATVPEIPLYEIVADEVSVLGLSSRKLRDVYILLNQHDLTKESIARLFHSVQSERCDPVGLMIVAYSNREMLDRKRRFDKLPTVIHFNDTEKGRRAEAAHYAKVSPSPSGYFRSTYYRDGENEYFDFSPDKDSPEMERVDVSDLKLVPNKPSAVTSCGVK